MNARFLARAAALALMLASLPASAQDAGYPYFSAELPLGPLAYVPARVSGNSVTYRSGAFLATWTRSDANGAPQIFYARVVTDGTGLDGTGLQLTHDDSTDFFDPVIAAGASNDLVIWDDEPHLGSLRTVRAQRIGTDGGVLDAAPFVVSPPDMTVSEGKQLAFGGGKYLASWIAGPAAGGPERPYAARIGSDGTLLDPAPFALDDGGYSSEWIGGAAYDGTNFMVVFSRRNLSTYTDSVIGERISPDGTVLDPGGFTIHTTSTSGDLRGTAVVFDGSEYVVAWMDDQSPLVIRAARVKPDGTVLDASPVTLWSTYPSGANYYIGFGGLGFDGTNFTVAWAVDNPVTAYATRFRAGPTTPPTLLDASPHSFGSTFPFTVASSPGAALIASAGNDGFAGRAFQADGGFGPTIALASAAAPQTDPAAAYGDGGYLVVWSDARLPLPGIYGARIGRGGALVDSDPFLIASGTYLGTPSVSFDGTQYLVAWDVTDGGKGVAARRVGQDGTLLDADPLWLGSSLSAPTQPHMAFDGRETVATWYGFGLQLNAIMPDGSVVLDGGIQLASSGYAPTLGWDGANLVLLYSRQNPPTYGDNDVFASFLDPDAGFAQGAERLVAGGTGEQDWPQVAAGAGEFFVVWATEPDPYSSQAYSIEGAWLADDGSVTDVSRNFGTTSPSVASYGTGFAVAATASGTPPQALLGITEPAESYVLSDAPGGVYTPAIASDGQGGLLAAYSIADLDPAVQNLRLRVRMVGLAEQGAACGVDADCGSGFCVDGICCDSACGGGAANSCQACSQARGAQADGVCTPLTGGSCGPGGICQSGSCVPLSTGGESGSGAGSSSGGAGSSSTSTGGGTSGTSSGGCGCGTGGGLDALVFAGLAFAILRRRRTPHR